MPKSPCRTADDLVAYCSVVRRRLLIAAIFLLAGAVVNVAVAWGCAYRNGHYSDDWHWITVPENNQFWLERRPHEWESGMLIGVTRHSGLGRNLTNARGSTRPPERVTVPYLKPGTGSTGPRPGSEVVVKNEARILEAEFGLPLRSFRWTSVSGRTYYPRSVDSRTYYHRSPTITMGGRVLPLLPIWPGFAVNTLFYAVVLWLLIPGPFVLRRFIRVQRGRCVKCGYPMGESGVCSECGKALPGRAKMAT